MSASRGRGFTLIEVVVAMAVSSVVVLGAHQLFAVVADTADRVPALARASNLARNQERLLRELLARAETGADSVPRFHGEAESVRFESWCAAPGGWLEPCAVELRLVPVDDSLRLELSWPGRHLRLSTVAGTGRFLYLRSALNGGEWLERWGEALSPPLAVQVVMGKTSLFLRIGARG